MEAVPSATDSLSSMLSAVSTMSSQMKQMSLALATAVIKHEGHNHDDAASTMNMGGMSMGSSTAMDSMASMTMDSSAGMAGMTMGTGTSSGMSMATATPTMSGMSGMDMGNDGECNISMVWNWNTINTCFLSKGWRVSTSGQFAGTCIGVFLWVVFLVFLGSVRRKFDNYITSNAKRRYIRSHGPLITDSKSGDSEIRTSESLNKVETIASSPKGIFSNALLGTVRYEGTDQGNGMLLNTVRPNLLEQIARALLYGFEYSITWLLGLILMSFNGYVIISAFLGATIGFMLLEWNYLHRYSGDGTPSAPMCC